jgi:hypothetical protein
MFINYLKKIILAAVKKKKKTHMTFSTSSFIVQQGATQLLSYVESAQQNGINQNNISTIFSEMEDQIEHTYEKSKAKGESFWNKEVDDLLRPYKIIRDEILVKLEKQGLDEKIKDSLAKDLKHAEDFIEGFQSKIYGNRYPSMKKAWEEEYEKYGFFINDHVIDQFNSKISKQGNLDKKQLISLLNNNRINLRDKVPVSYKEKISDAEYFQVVISDRRIITIKYLDSDYDKATDKSNIDRTVYPHEKSDIDAAKKEASKADFDALQRAETQKLFESRSQEGDRNKERNLSAEQKREIERTQKEQEELMKDPVHIAKFLSNLTEQERRQELEKMVDRNSKIDASIILTEISKENDDAVKSLSVQYYIGQKGTTTSREDKIDILDMIIEYIVSKNNGSGSIQASRMLRIRISNMGSFAKISCRTI